jgi:hypothetical protein
MERYSWHSFSLITGMIAGHRNFDQVTILPNLKMSWSQIYDF